MKKTARPTAAITEKHYAWFVIGLPLAVFFCVTIWEAYGRFVTFAQACSPIGYDSDEYLAVCDSEIYGDYEHGAFFLGLEPEAIRELKKAEILFVGNSRMQHGFSTDATARFFGQSRADRPYYLLGFGFIEPYLFTTALIEKLQPRPKVIVANLDEWFFLDLYSDPGKTVIQANTTVWLNYARKRAWQTLHHAVCGWMDRPSSPAWCGRKNTIFRSRTTGTWDLRNNHEAKNIPLHVSSGVDPAKVKELLPAVHKFLRAMPVRPECVIFITVPSPHWSPDNTRAIADAVGARFVQTESAGSDWKMIDDSHLIQEHAETWSAQALAQMKSAFETCGVRFAPSAAH